MKRVISTAIPLSLLVSCASPVSEVQVGMHQGQVETILGEPTKVEADGELTRYEYFNAKKFIPLVGLAQSDMEVVFKEGRVVSYGTLSESEKIQRHLRKVRREQQEIRDNALNR